MPGAVNGGAVVLEMRKPKGGKGWHEIGRCDRLVTQAGSLSSTNDEGHREVIHFGWIKGEGPCVWRSDGIDIEHGPFIRETHALNLEKLADLTDGEHHVIIYRPGGMQIPMRFRFEPAT